MSLADTIHRPRTRRAFLREAAGGTIVLWSGLMAAMTACNDDIVDPSVHVTLDFQTQRGVLNYWYAFAQLESDFYARVFRNAYPDKTVTDRAVLSNAFDATISQYSSLKQAIPDRISDGLLFDPSLINLSNRASVLGNAHVIADTVAQAYTTVAPFVTLSAVSTLAPSLIAGAVDRANGIRGQLELDPLTVAPLGPTAAMDALQPYFQTMFTLQHPEVVA